MWMGIFYWLENDLSLSCHPDCLHLNSETINLDSEGYWVCKISPVSPFKKEQPPPSNMKDQGQFYKILAGEDFSGI